jgi:hypothetical protein
MMMNIGIGGTSEEADPVFCSGMVLKAAQRQVVGICDSIRPTPGSHAMTSSAAHYWQRRSSQ